MRADMGKVLVERPRVRGGFVAGRTGRRYARAVRRGLDSGDGTPAREGIKGRYRGGHGRMKHFNEHLGPLRKFVQANVGRPWDTVYGEICQHVDRGNVVQKHILTHLFQYVAVEVEVIDGELYEKPRQGHYRYSPLRGPNQWYVCPRSGLLRRAMAENKRQRRARWQGRVPERPVAWVSANQFVRRSAGGWELVTVKPWPEPHPWGRAPRPPAFDVLFREVVSALCNGSRLAGYYGKRVYAVAVRPLSAGELAHLPVTLPGGLKAPNVVR
jgi:hypothetical protein